MRIDLVYESIYELKHAQWSLKEMERIAQVFDEKQIYKSFDKSLKEAPVEYASEVSFHPRTFFSHRNPIEMILENTQCINKGKYCVDVPRFELNVSNRNDTDPVKQPTGRDVLEQNLRELCAFEAFSDGKKSKWFEYMDQLINKCVMSKNRN